MYKFPPEELALGPATLYSFEQLIRLYELPDEGSKEEKEDLAAQRKQLRYTLSEFIEPLLEFAFRRNDWRSGDLLKQFKHGEINTEEALTKHINEIRRAFDLYVKVTEDNLYPEVLGLTIAEMSGYQFGILMRRING